MRQGFHLRNLGDKRSPFCSPTAAKTAHERPAVVERFGRSSTTAAVVPSGALAPRFATAVVVQAGAPPPSVESVREATALWLDDADLLGRKWLGIGWQGCRGKLLFIGVNTGV
jgi:hypothetical protein